MFKNELKMLVIDPNFIYWNIIKENEEWNLDFDLCFTKKKIESYLENNVYSLLIINLDYYNKRFIDSRYLNIREAYEGPIIFMSDHSCAEQRISWLELGAHDVWVRNIDFQELQLKIIRISELEINQYKYELAGYVIDESKQEIWYQEKKLKLAPIPYKLLLYLITNPNVNLSREVLLKEVWNYDVSAGDRVVDKNINTVRKITNDSRIKSVYREGYKFETENKE